MARDDVKILEAPRVITRPAEEAVVKHVKEVVYPTDYGVDAWRRETVGTNAAATVFAAVEPQGLTMREVGSIVDVTPSLTEDRELIDLALEVALVGEPEWKDYGVKAKLKGSATYDLPMEQPFFPVRVAADTKASIRPGATFVVGGGADRRKGDEDKFVLLFVTPRLVDP